MPFISSRFGYYLWFLLMSALIAGCAPFGGASATGPRTEPSQTQSEMERQPDLNTVYYVKVWALNLRECPSTKCRIISVLRKGDQVRPLTGKKGWYKVAMLNRDKSGWVAGRFLSVEPVKPGPRPELNAAPAPEPPSLSEEFSDLKPADSDSAPELSEELAK